MSTISRQMDQHAEAKPAARGVDGNRAAEGGDVFLTPRVVDARALEEFGAALRALIAQAGDEQRKLRSALGQGQSLSQAADAAVSELRSGLEQTLRASQSFDERLSEANGVLARAEALDATLANLRDSTESLITARLGELERRIDATMSDTQERLDHIALERATKANQIEDTIRQRLGEGERRATELESRFESRLEELESDRADKFVRLIDAIEARLDEAQGRLTEFDIALEERLKNAREQARGEFDELDRRSDTRTHGDASDDAMRAKIGTLERNLAQALLRLEELEAGNLGNDRPDIRKTA